MLQVNEKADHKQFKIETRDWTQNRLGIATSSFEFGVKFVKVAADSILDVKFRDRSLEILSLLIQETTETILRNLIMYEQCLPHCASIFTCYAKVLDNLIDTTNDMDILCKRDIFYN
ncbi:Protein of unknown function DUF247 [Theobroma cacao]|nr:Protein of unknown function DUF247 [Theobroma cacao]